jgi:hypothetical protein
VTEPGLTPFSVGELLSEEQFYEAQEKYGEGLHRKIGAEAIKTYAHGSLTCPRKKPPCVVSSPKPPRKRAAKTGEAFEAR